MSQALYLREFLETYDDKVIILKVIPGEALTLMTDGDVPLESEKWTLSDTNF